MRNRAQSAAPAPLRGPLLAALDVEYARASKAKDLNRMDEVSKVIEVIGKLWAAPEPVVPAAPMVIVPRVPAPEPLPEPPAPLLAVEDPVALPPHPQEAGGFTIQALLQRADPTPPVVTGTGQGERRRQARESVTAAVADVNRLTDADQYRYELALMVVNENMEAMSDLQATAAAEGLPVRDYAKRVVAQHTARRRRAAQVYAIEAEALKDIDAASGDIIDTIAAAAVNAIRGEDA